MNPLMPLGAIYTAGRLYDGYRYWSDYYRTTGYKPAYPMRTMAKDITPLFLFGNKTKKSPTRKITNRNYYYYHVR